MNMIEEGPTHLTAGLYYGMYLVVYRGSWPIFIPNKFYMLYIEHNSFLLSKTFLLMGILGFILQYGQSVI